jgi:Putative DNA-binding domain
MKPSLALTFFEQIQKLSSSSERVAFLERLIVDKKSEEDFLEFKGGLENGMSLSNEKVRELYGKALSSFANAGGGVLVWGIQTKLDSIVGVDRADSRALAPDIGKLCLLLESHQRDVTDPPVLGVKNLPVSKNGSEGYVVSFIPESHHRPHAYRKSKEEELYYMRVSAHSIPARQSTLRRLFFPEYHSRLELFFSSHQISPATNIQTIVWLHNKGPGTAEEVSILFQTQPIPWLNELNHPWKRIGTAWTDESRSRPADFFRAERSLHPGEMVNVYNFQTDGSKRLTTLSGSSEVVNHFVIDRFVFRLYACNEPPVEIEYLLKVKHVGNGNQAGTTRELDI